MEIPEQIEEVLEKLEKAGFEAYIVGGCVRDGIMGKTAHDYDITTSAEPSETERVFADCRVVETGIKHGTVTVLFKGMSVEITTFRVDGDYPDGRHPENVAFSRNLEDDLARRDFTMNAIAYSPRRGIIDIFGGEADIKSRVIRCVGEPEKRFSEDALRVMRALRFSAVLGFDIEESTKSALLLKKETLAKVSKERIFSELKQLLCGGNVKLVLLEYREVFAEIIPEIQDMFDYNQHSKYHNSTLFEHTARAVEAAPPREEMRLAMFFHDIGKPACRSTDENGEGHYYGHAAKSAELADKILRELKCDNALRVRVCEIIKYHDMPIELSYRAIKRRLSKLGGELFCDVMEAHIADDSAKQPFTLARTETAREAIRIAEEIAEEKPCLDLKALAVNGGDLKEIMEPSPRMGEILAELLNEVVDGTLENDKAALMARARELCTKP
ncbi:MAG: CCA tRNA nucleotidyltransferase [Oscillospiraceae bacterium]